MQPSRKKTLTLIGLFILGIVLLSLSFIITSDDSTSIGGSGLVLELEGPPVAETIRIKTEPNFDFRYEVDGDRLTLSPMSLLINNVEYRIVANYKNTDGENKSTGLIFTHVDETPASKLLDILPIANKSYSLYSVDRHHFYVRVTSSGGTEEGAIEYADRLFEEYGIIPRSVDLAVTFSRGALEDGTQDPFTQEVNTRSNSGPDFDEPAAPGSANQ